MNPVHIILVKTLNQLVKLYNNKNEDDDFSDVINYEFYVRSLGIDIPACNKEINKSKN